MPPPDDQGRRLVTPKVLLEPWVEGDIGAVVVGRVELDAPVSRAGKLGSAVKPAERVQVAQVPHAGGVLRLDRLVGEDRRQRPAVLLGFLVPLLLDRVPELARPRRYPALLAPLPQEALILAGAQQPGRYARPLGQPFDPHHNSLTTICLLTDVKVGG